MLNKLKFLKNKQFFLVLFGFLTITSLSSKEMELWLNDHAYDEFMSLSVEDQFNSYINSFKGVIDRYPQSGKWANRMVESHGRDVLPLVNKALVNASYDNIHKKPYDDTLVLLSYVLNYLKINKLLTESEIELYCLIFESKLDLYVLKHRKIDGTVRVAINGINSKMEGRGYPYTSEENAIFFEKRLGVEGISAGNFYSYWEE